MTSTEPEWIPGCFCDDCLYQRKYYGYELVNGEWVKKND